MKIIYCLIAAWLIAQNAIVLAEDEVQVATDVAVQVGQISKTTLRRYVKAYGMVEPKPATEGRTAASSRISASVQGIIKKTNCEEGQAVQQGFVLFELDSRVADDLVSKAQVAVDFAQKNLQRKQQLNATENISRKLYDDAEQLLQTAQKDLLTAQTQRALLKITAPLAGTIASCHVKVGEAVSLNAVLAEIIDVHRLDVLVKVSSTEAEALRLKQSVNIRTSSTTSSSDNNLRGQVTFISPQVDPFTDTVLVRASLPSNTNIRAGQFVHSQIAVEECLQCLTVPIDSVVTRDNTAFIAIVENNIATQREVKLGLREGNFVEIQGEGLHEGMSVVTQGVYGLPTQTRIRVMK